MAFDNARDGKEDFASMLEESLERTSFAGRVVHGTVVKVADGFATVDVGLKSEGRVPLREFVAHDSKPPRPGDKVDLFVERYEDRDGTAVLSREKAKREEAWGVLERAFEAKQHVEGEMCQRVKGGFTVDLGNIQAFLPTSQVDIRPVRDIGVLMRNKQPFLVIKMDRSRGNIVVSRRAVMEEERAGQRAELLAGMKEGMVYEGMVKNLTDYGAFVDLGGIDGLLHVTDMDYRRVNHPSEVLSSGQVIKVVVLRYEPEKQRISLGLKQLQPDPWVGVAAKYPRNSKVTGRVTNVADYGAFVELEPGVEGLVHMSEMSWSNEHPSRIVSTSGLVDVVILDVDESKRRVSLGMKQATENPWQAFADKYRVGSTVTGKVAEVSQFGVTVSFEGGIRGTVAVSDLAWDDQQQALAQMEAKVGQDVEAKLLSVDPERERVELGIKQLVEDPMAATLEAAKVGTVVTCTVTEVEPNGLRVRVLDTLDGFIRRAELGRDKQDQRPDRFAVGEKVDAKVTAVDRNGRRVTLSIRTREQADDREAMEKYGNPGSGASLGEILSAALRRNKAASSV